MHRDLPVVATYQAKCVLDKTIPHPCCCYKSMQIVHVLQAVAKWKKLAEESKWDEFVAAMLQEHYDAVYTRAQLKYLTPSSKPLDESQPANGATATHHAHETMQEGHEQSSHQRQQSDQTGQLARESHHAAKQTTDDSNEDTVQAAGALSHLFGGPRSKLMQQMGSKQLESTLRWHREPVADITDETYADLAKKLLQQYDPAALSASQC